MSEMIKTDICIIGAGSGGLSLAAGAVQMGARVVLIEAGKMGGDCLNYGCVPSKALLSAAKQGLSYTDAMAHVQATIATIEPHDSQERFEGLGCTVIRARASFVSSKIVEAGGTRVKARRFVIATGSHPFVPPIEGLDQVPYLTNETLWQQKELPKELIVLGGGPIGSEMALAHARLGSKVTLVEGDKILNRDDPEAAEVVRRALVEEGITLVEGALATGVFGTQGALTVTLKDGQQISGTDLLVAVGRVANTEGLGLDAGEVAHSRSGVEVDASMRTSNKKVYAIGDVVSGNMQFTHVAGYQAGVLIRSLLFGLPAKPATHYIPRATYTDPELAQIGLTEAEARLEHGDDMEVARAEVSGNDRAIATSRAKAGFIKVMVVKGRPVGVTIVGPDAGELITLWSLAMVNKLKMSQVAGMIAPYPTLAELNKRAAGAYFTPRLFDNPRVKQIVKLVQRLVP